MGRATRGQTVRMAIADALGEPLPSLERAPEDERLSLKTADDARRLLESLRRMAAARDPGTLTESYISAQRFMNELYKALQQNPS
jgi:hypothetical protein